ncbi:putative RNA-directed DNA polymerase from transposon BS [Trichonephila clavipes]|nr:putative RNA-directed DNA polymerase from transposon BS [Trichonephila clavipes]
MLNTPNLGCSTPNPRGNELLNNIDDKCFSILNDGTASHFLYSYNTKEALAISIASSDLRPGCKWTLLENLGSDHLPILIELKKRQLVPNSNNKQGIFYKVDWQSFAESVDNGIKSIPLRDSVDLNWCSFKELILRAAKKYISRGLDSRASNGKLWKLLKNISNEQPQAEQYNAILNEDGNLAVNDEQAANLFDLHYQKISGLNFSVEDRNIKIRASRIIHEVFGHHQLFLEQGAASSGLEESATIISIKNCGKTGGNPESYRPIALPSIACKIMEKMVLRRLTFHVPSHNLLPKEQSFSFFQGVPQGSVLSPTLFSLYLSGIENVIKRKCEIDAFEDDIVLWKSDSDLTKLDTDINLVLEDIPNFALDHKLTFNPTKSPVIFFTTNRKLYNFHINIFLHDQLLTVDKHPKYLGFILNPEIQGNKHIDSILLKARKRQHLEIYLGM